MAYELGGRGEASHPTWVRGLKPYFLMFSNYDTRVAPHVGALIETNGSQVTSDLRLVAPHVGAWIETCALASAL